MRSGVETWKQWLLSVLCLLAAGSMQAQQLTFVELNCENLFDCSHDEGKQDLEFLPEAPRSWTPSRYWRKLSHIGQTILACSKELPSVVALCEVENDSTMRDLTRRSLLRGAGYDYLMTQSPDERGLDVALLYQPALLRPLCYECIEVPPVKKMRPTRDILYVKALTRRRDTLHVFVVHAPSRYGGERRSRPFRRQAASVLARSVAPLLSQDVVVLGDFNDYADSEALMTLEQMGLASVTRNARGSHGAAGTYRYQGEWGSLDHVLVSPSLQQYVDTAYVADEPFLLEPDAGHGGVRPKRTYRGLFYQRGFSDHLPLVVRFRWE